MTDIKINAPGAGQWVMDRLGSRFMDGFDVSFTRHAPDGSVRGGIVLSHYIGGSMTAHMAGDDKHWFNRELAWLVFDYAFNQLGCIKLLAPLRSDNSRVIAMDMRGGWDLEAVVKDAYGRGLHMLILTMTRETCPWLNYKPKAWRANWRDASDG